MLSYLTTNRQRRWGAWKHSQPCARGYARFTGGAGAGEGLAGATAGAAAVFCPGGASSWRCGWVGGLVLDDQRDPAVGRIVGMCRIAEALIGKTPHLSNLIDAQAVLLHPSPGGIGAVG